MKFRKKPVVIEAVQYNGQTGVHGCCYGDECGVKLVNRPMPPHIHTLEGVMEVSHRDWVIRGIKGEFYPCKPDIFAATYEPVGDSAAPSQPRESAQDCAMEIITEVISTQFTSTHEAVVSRIAKMLLSWAEATTPSVQPEPRE